VVDARVGGARRGTQGGPVHRGHRHGFPSPDSGEEYFHTNTQLYNILDDHNRFKIGEGEAPWNAPPHGAAPTMDGFVTDYISTFTGETGRQPTYDEYAHIMTGCTPAPLRSCRCSTASPARAGTSWALHPQTNVGGVPMTATGFGAPQR
jgi:hypothetical protein